ncbi:hypothetical protein MKW94_019094 [Papaver nudicaule]|uniref:Receptor-like protein 12 n=1 Tax=Papaver nudicaule TaxID=74823 RepID=A0AA41VEI5_PAPNU|nr:hypothetical protein [Papaver nudicaule]
MMVNVTEAEWNRKDQILGFKAGGAYYQQTVTLRSKGQDMELAKILTIFTAIDLSDNNFEGEIPTNIGNLTSLHVLNLSSNAFTSLIPATIGNLTQLESLDLSRNKLIGKIPFQLASISSLSFLNLSFNLLKGEIPSGSQFQTFQTNSFEGNVGLCGFPLSKSCKGVVGPPPNAQNSKDQEASVSKDGFDWVLFAVTFLGFVVGAGVVIGPQYFWKKGRAWVNERINKILNIS